MSIANIANQVLLWIHGLRLGLLGDGQGGTNSAIVLDGTVVATTRKPIVTYITSLSGAGSITLAGVLVGDNVISVLDTSSFTDVSSSFESSISVAGKIQQSASTSGHTVQVTIQPQS